MNQEQLRKKIEHSLNEGFTEQEVRNVLRQQNVPHSQINKAFRQINSGQQTNPGNQQNQSRGQNSRSQGLQGNSQQNNSFSQNNSQNQNRNPAGNQRESQQQNRQQSQSQSFGQSQNGGPGSANQSTGFSGGSQGPNSPGGAIPGLDLSDSYYKIRQQLFLTRYSVYDQNDEKVLKAKSKILSLKTNIPFLRPEDEEPIFRVVSERLPNISNNYEVRNEQSDDILAILDRKRTLLNQVWRIRDPDDNSIVATIKNDNTMLQFLRTYGGIVPLIPNFFALIPHTYNVIDVNDQKIGQLEGELSIRDEYDLNLQDSGQLDRESMVASIIAIDALEGN